MPKASKSKDLIINNFVDEFKGEFKQEDNKLICILCSKTINTIKRYNINSHRNSTMHKRYIEQQPAKTSTSQLGAIKDFNEQLCEAFIDADIPLFKLENTKFKLFLTEHMGKDIACTSTLREKYLPMIFERRMENIRKAIKDKKVWIGIDETIDAMKRNVANVIIGTLDTDLNTEEKGFFLVMVKFWDQVNSTTVFQTVLEALNTVYLHGIPYNDILLFLTDAAPYMIKSGKFIQGLCPKIIHVTCAAHGLHRIAEEIRLCYPKIDKLISSTKQVFKKAPSRINRFREMQKLIPLPSEPVLTRWGTWLASVSYYSKYYDEVKNVVDSLDDDAACVRDSKESFANPKIKLELSFINAHYCFIKDVILKLENRNLELIFSIDLIEKVVNELDKVPGGINIKKKCDQVFSKNIGLTQLKKISKVLLGEANEELKINLNPDELASFKYAPITTCDLERSFSQYKSILRENRRRFDQSTLCKYMVIYYNS